MHRHDEDDEQRLPRVDAMEDAELDVLVLVEQPLARHDEGDADGDPRRHRVRRRQPAGGRLDPEPLLDERRARGGHHPRRNGVREADPPLADVLDEGHRQRAEPGRERRHPPVPPHVGDRAAAVQRAALLRLQPRGDAHGRDQRGVRELQAGVRRDRAGVARGAPLRARRGRLRQGGGRRSCGSSRRAPSTARVRNGRGSVPREPPTRSSRAPASSLARPGPPAAPPQRFCSSC